MGSHPPCCVGYGLVSRLGVALEEHSDTVGSGIGASAEVASVACHAPLFVLQNKSISRSCWACECVKRQPMPGEGEHPLAGGHPNHRSTPRSERGDNPVKRSTAQRSMLRSLRSSNPNQLGTSSATRGHGRRANTREEAVRGAQAVGVSYAISVGTVRTVGSASLTSKIVVVLLQSNDDAPTVSVAFPSLSTTETVSV